jgi:hypothetical protein
MTSLVIPKNILIALKAQCIEFPDEWRDYANGIGVTDEEADLTPDFLENLIREGNYSDPAPDEEEKRAHIGDDQQQARRDDSI